MTRRFPFVLVVLLSAGLLAACGENYAPDIAAVRAARTLVADRTNDEIALQVAGARGKVEWSAGRPEKYRDNQHIVGVDATIERTTQAGARRVLLLSFIRNRQTQQIAFEQLAIDGQPQGLIGGALNLLLMQLE